MPLLSLEEYTDLILVCCHATYTGSGTSTEADQWLLQPFQRANAATGKRSEHETFITHIMAGALAAQQQPRALLVFSGGKTAHPDISEAAGYARVLKSFGSAWSDVSERLVLEELATDSYENLLFSIIRYWETVGRWPQNVTIITHAFKERRFLDLHAKAIKWPSARIRVQGVNPPFTREELAQTQRAELDHAYNKFEQDPYGVQQYLGAKRKARNWKGYWLEGAAYSRLGSDRATIDALLKWCGGDSGREIFPGELPWQTEG